MKTFAEIKAEMAKEIAERNEKIRETSRKSSATTVHRLSPKNINGICPKCHTYCYGDCESN